MTEQLKETLCYETKHAAKVLDAGEMQAAQMYAEGYKRFLNNAKTEREAVTVAVALAEQHGFRPFDPADTFKAGDKVYLNNRGKSLILAVIGEKPLSEGVNFQSMEAVSSQTPVCSSPRFSVPISGCS